MMRATLMFLAAALLAGCGDIPKEAIKAEVSAQMDVLSPKLTASLSNQLQATLQATLQAELKMAVSSEISAAIEQHEATTQTASQGDQAVTAGASAKVTTVGGGNSTKLDGATAVFLAMVITAGLLGAYAIRSGYRFGRQAVARYRAPRRSTHAPTTPSYFPNINPPTAARPAADGKHERFAADKDDTMS